MAILQQLQLLSEQPRTVTLADIMAELVAMQQEFGTARSLEEIIQHQAGAQLAAQRSARQARKAVTV
jgi:hypothetical protein